MVNKTDESVLEELKASNLKEIKQAVNNLHARVLAETAGTTSDSYQRMASILYAAGGGMTHSGKEGAK